MAIQGPRTEPTHLDVSMPEADFVLRERGTTQHLGAYVIAARFTRMGIPAFALGDGTIRLPTENWQTVEAHDGGILSLTDWQDGWATAGDDGHLRHTTPDGTTTTIASFGSKWVDHTASWTAGTPAILAASVGKTIHVFGANGQKLKELPHLSTVSGIAFDTKGKRIAASHYNGVTLWFTASKTDNPRTLEWKGSHTGVLLHPAGEAAVSTMQENALHGWRLSDNQHMRMSGYPTKTESISFSRTGKWLASSGAESVVLWSFFAGGPMGKSPTELAGGDGVICTRVAFHPQQDMVAAGFSDGLVVLADIASERILPLAPPGQGSVSALAWALDGTHLAVGTETGFAALLDLSNKD